MTWAQTTSSRALRPDQIGGIYALAAGADFDRGGLCFAAGDQGLFRSDDGGMSWRSAYDALGVPAPLPTTAVVIAPTGAPTPCVPEAAARRELFAAVHGAILRSHDGGATWHTAMLPMPPPLVSALCLSPDYLGDGTLFAGTMEDGVFRSADRGATWVSWNFGLLDLNVSCLAVSPDYVNDETLLAGTESGVFRSTNGGRAWRETAFPMEHAPVVSLALSPAYGRDGVIFAGCEAGGLFRSDNRGRTWEPIGAGVISDSVNAIVLAADFPRQPAVLVASGTTLWISRDGGASWTEWPTEERFAEAITAVVAPLGLDEGAPLLVGLSAGGVRRV